MEKAYSWNSPRKSKSEILLALLCLSQTVILTAYFFLWPSLRSQEALFPDQLNSWTDCGLSSADARARNCQFDPMLYAWIPNECFHPEPLDEYDPFNDRTWYIDANLTEPLDSIQKVQLASGDLAIAYTHTFHHEHCLYAMRKLAMATERRWLLIDGKSANVWHTTHCSKQIAHFVRGTVEKTIDLPDSHHATARLQFPGCVALPWRL